MEEGPAVQAMTLNLTLNARRCLVGKVGAEGLVHICSHHTSSSHFYCQHHTSISTASTRTTSPIAEGGIVSMSTIWRGRSGHSQMLERWEFGQHLGGHRMVPKILLPAYLYPPPACCSLNCCGSITRSSLVFLQVGNGIWGLTRKDKVSLGHFVVLNWHWF